MFEKIFAVIGVICLCVFNGAIGGMLATSVFPLWFIWCLVSGGLYGYYILGPVLFD
jgi:hypothetical protein